MPQPSDRPTIRQYHPDDASGCRSCVVELQDALRVIDPRLRPGELMADEYFAQMHARCQRDAGTIFVAEYSGRIAGLAMVLASVPYESLDEPSGSYALLAELVVRDGFRRLGIGRDLLHAAETFARDHGAIELRIAVLSENDAARRLYIDEGFAPYLEILSRSLSN